MTDIATARKKRTAPTEDTAEDNTDSLPGDDLALLPTGRIRIRLADDANGGSVQTWTLRRPKVGEYRHLRERLHELAEEGRSRRLEIARAKVPEATEGDELNAVASSLSAVEYDAAAEMEQWMAEVMEVLGDSVFPPDAMPLWMTSPTMPALLVTHWRTVPFRAVGGSRGGQTNGANGAGQ